MSDAIEITGTLEHVDVVECDICHGTAAGETAYANGWRMADSSERCGYWLCKPCNPEMRDADEAATLRARIETLEGALRGVVEAFDDGRVTIEKVERHMAAMRAARALLEPLK